MGGFWLWTEQGVTCRRLDLLTVVQSVHLPLNVVKIRPVDVLVHALMKPFLSIGQCVVEAPS